MIFTIELEGAEPLRDANYGTKKNDGGNKPVYLKPNIKKHMPNNYKTPKAPVPNKVTISSPNETSTPSPQVQLAKGTEITVTTRTLVSAGSGPVSGGLQK